MGIRSVGETVNVWLSQLDPAIQGAVIGAGSAVAATIISVLVTAVVTWLQLRHAKSERETDRTLEIKKDVLLESAKGARECMSSISMQSNLDVSDEELTARFSDGSQKMVLAQVVATPNTIASLNALMKNVTKTYLSLQPKRLEILMLKIDADIAAQKVKRILEHQGVLLSQQQDAALNQDREKLSVANEMLNKSFEIFSHSQKESESLSNFFLLERTKFTPECLAAQFSLENIYSDFIHAIRIELGSSSVKDAAYFDATRFDHVAAMETLELGLEPLRVRLQEDRAAMSRE